MQLNVHDRELMLQWILITPTGSYVPKLAQILKADAEGTYAGPREFVQAILKDSGCMLLFTRFVLENHLFLWAMRIIAHGDNTAMFTKRERCMLGICAVQCYDYDEVCCEESERSLSS